MLGADFHPVLCNKSLDQIKIYTPKTLSEFEEDIICFSTYLNASTNILLKYLKQKIILIGIATTINEQCTVCDKRIRNAYYGGIVKYKSVRENMTETKRKPVFSMTMTEMHLLIS